MGVPGRRRREHLSLFSLGQQLVLIFVKGLEQLLKEVAPIFAQLYGLYKSRLFFPNVLQERSTAQGVLTGTVTG